MFWMCETFCGGFVRLFSDWLCLRMPNFYTLDCHNNNNNNNNNDDNSAFFPVSQSSTYSQFKNNKTLFLVDYMQILFPLDKCAVYLRYVS